MRYRLSLFRTEENAAHVAFSIRHGRPFMLDTLLPVETGRIAAELRRAFETGLLAGPERPKAVTGTANPPYSFHTCTKRLEKPEAKDVSWLDISFDRHVADRLVPVLLVYAFRCRYNLLDWQKAGNNVWKRMSFVNDRLPMACGRASELLQPLCKAVHPRHIHRVEKMNPNDCCACVGYVLVLSKHWPGEDGLRHIVRAMDTLLHESLRKDETIDYGYRMVEIHGPGYCVSFSVECGGKYPNMTAFMNDGWHYGDTSGKPGVVIEPLGRMSTDLALKKARALYPGTLEDSPITRRMGTARMWGRYSNPADRFAASVRIDETLRRMDMQMACDSVCEIPCAVSLEVYNRWRGDVDFPFTDVLHLESETFDLLLPAVSRVLGEGFDYYSSANMLNQGHLSQLIAELKRTAWLIRHDPASSELAEWRNGVLLGFFGPREYEQGQKDPSLGVELIKKHRNRLSLFFSFLIEWMEDADCCDVCLNIDGL